MAETTALAITQDYPSDKFNLLIPVKTIQELSPMHKVVVNEVQINPDPAAKDVYKEKNGELALTKKGLAKLMAAANIQIIDSRPTSPARCERCYELAARTRVAPKCFECPYQDDVAHKVTIAVPEPSGTHRLITATKELRMEDERKKMTEKQFESFFPYRSEHCETKALNRALREGLMVSSTYKAEELQKPFAVGLVVPNFADPDMKKAMVQRYAKGVDELFGPSGSSPAQIEAATTREQAALPEASTSSQQTIDITPGPAPAANPTPTFEDDFPPDFPSANHIACEGTDCGAIIEEITDAKGKKWSPQELADWTQKNLGKKLCGSCMREELRKLQRGGAK